MQVELEGFEPERGEASSKRAAEQAAAQAFLEKWATRHDPLRLRRLIGAPNAGKSTLLNALVGAKISIVSRKAQTTRATVRGVVVEGEAQIVFVDTPGLFPPKRRLDRAMNAAAWGAASDADVDALLIDARAETAAAGKAVELQRRRRPERGDADHPGLAQGSARSSVSDLPTPRRARHRSDVGGAHPSGRRGPPCAGAVRERRQPAQGRRPQRGADRRVAAAPGHRRLTRRPAGQSPVTRFVRASTATRLARLTAWSPNRS